MSDCFPQISQWPLVTWVRNSPRCAKTILTLFCAPYCSDNQGMFYALIPSVPFLTTQLSPCGLTTPHTHPRATEMLYAVNGTIQAGMLQENGARFVYNEFQAGQVTVFPQVCELSSQGLSCCLTLLSFRVPFISSRTWDAVSNVAFRIWQCFNSVCNY